MEVFEQIRKTEFRFKSKQRLYYFNDTQRKSRRDECAITFRFAGKTDQF